MPSENRKASKTLTMVRQQQQQHGLTRFKCLQPKTNLLSHANPQLVSQEECIDTVQDSGQTDSLAPQRSRKGVDSAQLRYQYLLLLQVLSLGSFCFLRGGGESNSLPVYIRNKNKLIKDFFFQGVV